jgi:hypothetical protein
MIENARIGATMLGLDDRGVFTFGVTLVGDNWSQGYGNWSLQVTGRDPRGDAVGAPWAGPMILGLLGTLKVDRWERLRGQLVVRSSASDMRSRSAGSAARTTSSSSRRTGRSGRSLPHRWKRNRNALASNVLFRHNAIGGSMTMADRPASLLASVEANHRRADLLPDAPLGFGQGAGDLRQFGVVRQLREEFAGMTAKQLRQRHDVFRRHHLARGLPAAHLHVVLEPEGLADRGLGQTGPLAEQFQAHNPTVGSMTSRRLYLRSTFPASDICPKSGNVVTRDARFARASCGVRRWAPSFCKARRRHHGAGRNA